MIETELLGVKDGEYLTAEQVRELLRNMSQPRGAQKQLARVLGVTRGYLSRVSVGKDDPSPKILDALGLEKRTVTVYVQKEYK